MQITLTLHWVRLHSNDTWHRFWIIEMVRYCHCIVLGFHLCLCFFLSCVLCTLNIALPLLRMLRQDSLHQSFLLKGRHFRDFISRLVKDYLANWRTAFLTLYLLESVTHWNNEHCTMHAR